MLSRDLLETVGVTLGTVGAVGAAVTWFLRPRFDDLVLSALDRRKADYRVWAGNLWREDIMRWDQTHAIALSTQLGLEGLRQSFDQFRADMNRHVPVLTMLPTVLMDLQKTLQRHEQTDEKLNTTLGLIAEQLTDTRIKTAEQTARVHALEARIAGKHP